MFMCDVTKTSPYARYFVYGEYRDQPWFSVFKHSLDHEEGV